jgi:hypothetical protein
LTRQKPHHATFRFYEELNDFLPPDRRKTASDYAFDGTPAIKDAIEAQGVPHTEVDLILVNDESVDFGYRLQDGDRVAVYPVFESLDISSVGRLRQQPLRRPAFVADVHLGTLARRLRLLGFDTLYENDFTDDEIIRLSIEQHRVILTRDGGILKTGRVTHGYYVRSTIPHHQVREVLSRFDLVDALDPFRRCSRCNGVVKPVSLSAVADRLPPRVAETYDAFFQCTRCGQLYWKGTHYQRLLSWIDSLSA